MDLGKKEAALTASETKLETLKAHQANQQEHISVLQTSLSAKEHHIKDLQTEVTVSHYTVITRKSDVTNVCTQEIFITLQTVRGIMIIITTNNNNTAE